MLINICFQMYLKCHIVKNLYFTEYLIYSELGILVFENGLIRLFNDVNIVYNIF